MVALKPGRPARRGPRQPGSRNAVVALKQRVVPIEAARNSSKQERRGGIETGGKIDNACLARWKQERRGGIETEFISPHLRHRDKEAGTPWWH